MKYAVDLDDIKAIKAGDPANMLGALGELANQCRQAVSLARGVDIDTGRSFRNVLVTGLGGSAIGGDFLRVYAAKRCPVPVAVNRDYSLPAYVNEDTLIFATSYSGNTEETLSAYREARSKKAYVVVITSGGQLGESARQDNVPFVSIPGGLQPRAATGYLFLPTLVVMEKLGLMSGVSGDFDDLFAALEDYRNKIGPENSVEVNPAKQMAQRFFGKIPVIWGAFGTTETVAMRWKGQINENSKAPAYFNVFPELNHNEIVGTEFTEDILNNLQLVFLRDEEDHPRVEKRFKITREIIGDRVGGITEVWGSGKSSLARMFTLTCLGDYTSVYLALLYGVDPSPVELITLLKNRLAEE